MTATATPVKLKPNQAQALYAADVAVERAAAALQTVKERRAELRERYRPLLPERELVTVGGYEIKVTPTTGAPGFSLRGYLDAGHQVTADMEPHVSPPPEYDRWTVKLGAEKRSRKLGV